MKRIIAIAIASLTLASAVVLGLCGCTAWQNVVSIVDSPKSITVKVLDKSRESIPGASFTDYWIETAYEYDGTGKLAGTSQTTNYSKNTINLAKGAFEYDEAGRLVKVSHAYEQYAWNVGTVETLSYDDQGACTEYAYDVVSQGYGGISLAYTYADGRIAKAVETVRDTPGPEGSSFDVVWSYTDAGKIDKVIAGAGGDAGFGLVEELSDPAQGTYAYRAVNDGLTTLKFNEDGTLASTTTRSANGQSVTQKTYEYKTITVETATYTPTVYSNPTGFDPQWKPQITLAEVPYAPADSNAAQS